MTLTITEINAETGKTITRPMTDEEVANHQRQVQIRIDYLAKQESEKAEAETKKAAAEAKLEALGLTPEDLKALGLQATTIFIDNA